MDTLTKITYLENCSMYILRPLNCFSIMIVSKLVSVYNCPLVRQTQHQFLKACKPKKMEVNKTLMIKIMKICDDTCTCSDAWPQYSIIDIRHCTRFIEKFLCRSRMAAHKPTMAVSQFFYVFFLDFDGGHLTVAQLLSKCSSVGVASCNSSKMDSHEKLWSASGLA